MISALRQFGYLKSQTETKSLTKTQGVSHRTDITNGGGNIVMFVDSSGAQGLWVPFGASDNELTADTKSRFIALRPVPQEGKTVAELRLVEPALESVLYTFVDAYFKQLASDSESAVMKLAAQLNRWRSLFTPSTSHSLGVEEELGLIGELQTLEELLETEGELAFYRWTGPDASRHDFRFDDREIECKATTIGSGLRVKINGSRQLDLSEDRPLLLAIRQYEKTPNGSLALHEMVGELLMDERIPPEEFLGKIRGLGYSSIGENSPTGLRYEHLETHVFEVGEDFPRLGISELPKRVIHLSYTLDLTPPEDIPGYRPGGSLL